MTRIDILILELVPFAEGLARDYGLIIRPSTDGLSIMLVKVYDELTERSVMIIDWSGTEMVIITGFGTNVVTGSGDFYLLEIILDDHTCC